MFLLLLHRPRELPVFQLDLIESRRGLRAAESSVSEHFCCQGSEHSARSTNLVHAPLGGDVEAVLSRRVALHLHDLSRDGRGQEDLGLDLLEAHCVVNSREEQPVSCRGNKPLEHS